MIIHEINSRNQTPKMIIPSCLNILTAMILTVCLAIGADEVVANPKPTDDISAIVKKAESGDADAQCRLGLRYSSGRGITKDDAQAASWYRKAAEQGHASGQCNLGISYAIGLGVPKDDVQAYMWYKLASVTDPNAVKKLDKISQKMTPEQIAEAQRLSNEWKPTKTNK